MSEVNKKTSWFALIVSHMCGLIDLAALPVWVGVLIAGYAFLPAQAGGLATLFLIGAVLASLFLAPRFHRMNGRWLAPAGFAVSTLCFAAMTQTTAFGVLALFHAIAGVATGLAVSLAHGTMGRTANPHRIFAYGGLALGFAALIYLGLTPELVRQSGPATLFWVFATVMGFATIVTAAFFPSVPPLVQTHVERPRFSAEVWFVIGAIMLMALNNAMILSFAERVGDHRGFTAEQMQLALIIMGIVAIFPSLIAVFLQSRLRPMTVGMVGAMLHGLVALGTMTTDSLPLFMVLLVCVPFTMVFTHTFVFGHLARIEPSGRAVAGTPAMVMTGSAIGPFLGGTIVQVLGYDQLGYLALVVGALAIGLFGLSARANLGAPVAAARD